MSQNIEILRRESLISVLSERKKSNQTFVDKIKNAPRNSSILCCIFFFFMGYMSLAPMLFIGTAANYWMFKFRNASAPANDTSRTSLQSLYQSTSTVAISIPSVFLSFLGTIYGRKFDARRMILFSLTVIWSIFLIFVIFTRVNTDSWQLGFFITVMMLQGVNSAAMGLYQLFSMVILSKFPQSFMKWYLFGQSGGVITDILQIISISVTDSDTDAALIYFLTGTILVAAKISLSFGIKYTKLYAYYAEDSSEDEEPKEDVLSWTEIKEVGNLIWPAVVIMCVVMFTLTCVHPSVTSLVESQQYGSGGSPWGNKYFTPVITFFLSDASGMVGRLFSYGKVTRHNFIFWLSGIVIRTIVSVGIVILFNAQPRSHLPVIFDQDWQFILFIVLFQISGGFLLNICFLSVPGLSAGKPETALKLLSLTLSIAVTAFSANGILVVKLL